MNFIESQIQSGYTHIAITNRGLKGDPSQTFKVFHYKGIDSLEKYNEIVESPIHANHPNGFSVGFMKEVY